MADKIISSTLSKGTSSQVKSVWGVPLQSQDQAPSLSDVMSEQMATDLQEKEDKSELKKIVAHIRETEGTVEASESFADNEADVADEQCTDDLLIAQMLQLQFDQVFQFCQVMGFTYDLRWFPPILIFFAEVILSVLFLKTKMTIIFVRPFSFSDLANSQNNKLFTVNWCF